MRKYILPLILITILFACKKDIMNTDQSASLHFSNDTVIFDTAFHSIGTPTQTLTVYNRNNFTVITDISLNQISEGSFRINVDGTPGNSHKGVKIPAKDSIFIFLEITPNQNSNNDFLLTSSIDFTTGTKQQDIKLVAPGRNANFHLPHDNIFTDGTDSINYQYYSIKGQQTWTNELPHVIYGQVIIEPNASLTIEQGTEIYFHNGSGIFVGNPILSNSDGTPPLNNGTLIVNGSLNNEVVFKGDRLDSWYENIPGQWNGIYFAPGSVNSTINYAIIKNGNFGLRADSVANSNPTITINNTIIENMSSIGILGQGATIEANNTLISRCGQYTVACNIGGTYNFTHCTFANYWDYSHRNTPSILLNNYYEGADGNIYIRDLNAANFINCIIYGNQSNEIEFQKQDLGIFNYTFDHSLLRIDSEVDTETSNYINCIINEDPKFKDYPESDFHLDSTSIAIDAAKFTFINNDIEGTTRTTPDIGAYEYY